MVLEKAGSNAVRDQSFELAVAIVRLCRGAGNA
jgi:hypothetical protein